jgi:hypothetical protein
MRTFARLALFVAALTLPSIAAAATPQGKLTGSAVLLTPWNSPFKLAIGETVTDGGTSYIGLENDESGTCSGDTGTISTDVGVFTEVGVAPIVCAHYVADASPKMRFAFKQGPHDWLVVKVTDKPVALAWTDTATLAEAKAVVNMGLEGSGVGGSWVPAPIVSGGYTVTA